MQSSQSSVDSLCSPLRDSLVTNRHITMHLRDTLVTSRHLVYLLRDTLVTSRHLVYLLRDTLITSRHIVHTMLLRDFNCYEDHACIYAALGLPNRHLVEKAEGMCLKHRVRPFGEMHIFQALFGKSIP